MSGQPSKIFREKQHVALLKKLAKVSVDAAETSLLAQVAAADIEPSLSYEQRQAAAANLRAARDRAVCMFLAGKRGLPEFNQFCTQLMKAADASGLAELAIRQTIIGAGIEWAWRRRRKAGRQKSLDPELFEHAWMQLYWENKVKSTFADPGARVPASKIAAYCAQHGLGSFTADQVRKSLHSK